MSVVMTMKWPSVAAAGTFVLLLAACSSLPTGVGEVDGGIVRCFAIVPPGNPTVYVAGTVDVYRNGQSQLLTPVSVADNQRFRLLLAPGTYQLVGHWQGSNLPAATTTVTVVQGQKVNANLVYRGCM